MFCYLLILFWGGGEIEYLVLMLLLFLLLFFLFLNLFFFVVFFKSSSSFALIRPKTVKGLLSIKNHWLTYSSPSSALFSFFLLVLWLFMKLVPVTLTLSLNGLCVSGQCEAQTAERSLHEDSEGCLQPPGQQRQHQSRPCLSDRKRTQLNRTSQWHQQHEGGRQSKQSWQQRFGIFKKWGEKQKQEKRGACKEEALQWRFRQQHGWRWRWWWCWCWRWQQGSRHNSWWNPCACCPGRHQRRSDSCGRQPLLRPTAHWPRSREVQHGRLVSAPDGLVAESSGVPAEPPADQPVAVRGRVQAQRHSQGVDCLPAVWHRPAPGWVQGSGNQRRVHLWCHSKMSSAYWSCFRCQTWIW